MEVFDGDDDGQRCARRLDYVQLVLRTKRAVAMQHGGLSIADAEARRNPGQRHGNGGTRTSGRHVAVNASRGDHVGIRLDAQRADAVGVRENRWAERINDVRLPRRKRDAGLPRRAIGVAALEIRQRHHGRMIVRVRDPERGEKEPSRAGGGAADDRNDQVVRSCISRESSPTSLWR